MPHDCTISVCHQWVTILAQYRNINNVPFAMLSCDNLPKDYYGEMWQDHSIPTHVEMTHTICARVRYSVRGPFRLRPTNNDWWWKRKKKTKRVHILQYYREREKRAHVTLLYILSGTVQYSGREGNLLLCLVCKRALVRREERGGEREGMPLLSLENSEGQFALWNLCYNYSTHIQIHWGWV